MIMPARNRPLWHIVLLIQSPWIIALSFRKMRENLVNIGPPFLGFVVVMILTEFLGLIGEPKNGI
jgi:hypothetical protein